MGVKFFLCIAATLNFTKANLFHFFKVLCSFYGFIQRFHVLLATFLSFYCLGAQMATVDGANPAVSPSGDGNFLRNLSDAGTFFILLLFVALGGCLVVGFSYWYKNKQGRQKLINLKNNLLKNKVDKTVKAIFMFHEANIFIFVFNPRLSGFKILYFKNDKRKINRNFEITNTLPFMLSTCFFKESKVFSIYFS